MLIYHKGKCPNVVYCFHTQMEVTIARKVKLSMGEQKKYQGDNRVAKRNRKFYNSGVKIKTTTSGSAGTESDGAIRSEKDRRQEGE